VATAVGEKSSFAARRCKTLNVVRMALLGFSNVYIGGAQDDQSHEKEGIAEFARRAETAN
jgi:hypothetical protein